MTLDQARKEAEYYIGVSSSLPGTLSNLPEVLETLLAAIPSDPNPSPSHSLSYDIVLLSDYSNEFLMENTRRGELARTVRSFLSIFNKHSEPKPYDSWTEREECSYCYLNTSFLSAEYLPEMTVDERKSLQRAVREAKKVIKP